jgi:hypothetical protein
MFSGASAGYAQSYVEGDTTDLLGQYLVEIGGTPLLTAQQEVELAKWIEAGVYARHLLAESGELPADRLATCARWPATVPSHRII